MVASPSYHISLDERGIAYLSGTKMKVRQIVAERNAWGLTPEEIQEGHEHLSLAQIHAALSYYYDHKSAMDAEIERVREEVEAFRRQTPESFDPAGIGSTS